ncbi:GIY-YIG nuclease family protein [Halalkalibacterium ligniniphilum]|uniref:GIY-YIG nuclease family protein n=1 Tax=Halalkalibacterium ligniniphilum TaxID=1134413 RepID=UPI00037C921A|nr:GIY-YIG nuclease family protein [Halalkalibacterium ligniniphilum]
MNYYMYVLECKDGSWYTGYTTDIERRLSMHAAGKGAKYTRGRGPFHLVYACSYETKTEALQAEHAFKRLSRRQKEQFVAEKGVNDEETSQFSS